MKQSKPRVIKVNSQRDLETVHYAFSDIDKFYMQFGSPKEFNHVLFNIQLGVICDSDLNLNIDGRDKAMYFFRDLAELLESLYRLINLESIEEENIESLFSDHSELVTLPSAINYFQDISMRAFTYSIFVELGDALYKSTVLVNGILSLLKNLQALRYEIK